MGIHPRTYYSVYYFPNFFPVEHVHLLISMRFSLLLKACKTRSNFLKKKTLDNIHIISKILLSVFFIRDLIKSTLVYYRWPLNSFDCVDWDWFHCCRIVFIAHRLCTDLYVEFTACDFKLKLIIFSSFCILKYFDVRTKQAPISGKTRAQSI